MKEIYLVRHAQSVHHVTQLTGGWTDTGITELGRRQAELTGTRLASLIDDESTVSFISSDLKRAKETGGILSGHMGLEMVLDSGLRELNNGSAAGLTRQEAGRIENPITQPTLDWIPHAGAESWRMMTDRLFKCMARLATDSRADTSIVVSHGNAAIAIVHWWLQLSESSRSRTSFEFDPCSISHLSINPFDERTIVKLNDTGHLAEIQEA
jgi:broad specificity phosphatase PhoE